MPDAMDRVQQHAQDMTADALAEHARRPVAAGRTHCGNLDCREPIAPERWARSCAWSASRLRKPRECIKPHGGVGDGCEPRGASIAQHPHRGRR